MPNKIDYVGHKYGKVIVIGEGELRGRHNRYVLCKCECGNEKLIYIGSLRKGATTSCGCMEAERREKFATMWTTHGVAQKPINNVYFTMRARCTNPKHIDYKSYGGRGIKCERPTFVDFYNDMGDSYRTHCEKYGARKTTIDREDNDGNYCKENCRRITPQEQSLNKRNTKLIEYNGKKQTMSMWAREIGIGRRTLSQRYYVYKRPIEKVLTTKVKQ